MEIVIALYILFVMLTAGLASAKGRSVGKWVVFALFCAPLALIIAIIVDDYVPPHDRYRTHPTTPGIHPLSAPQPPAPANPTHESDLGAEPMDPNPQRGADLAGGDPEADAATPSPGVPGSRP